VWWSKELEKRIGSETFVPKVAGIDFPHPKGMLGKFHTEGTRNKISKKLKGRRPHNSYDSVSKKMKEDNPIHKPENKEKHRLAVKKWAKERKEKGLSFGGAGKKPNKIEKLLMRLLESHLPSQFEFVGNGIFWVGSMNPDFKHKNGERKVIEVYGDYWHRGEDPKDRIDLFKECGYDCLVIWEHELKTLEEEIIVRRIKNFNT